MPVLEDLNRILASLPERRLQEVLDFARFLSCAEERQEWQQAGKAQLARAYGPDEPDYSESDLQPRKQS
jgi:hypothetical protein